ncbi:MAG TPA: septation ring formation regulator EzrA, partial [Savagea sp.]
QYGNRYRLQNEELHTRLLEAEESFSQFRYAKALEEAGTAVEEAEPGAIKKIEMMLQTTSN